jgi:hypothetical protein
MKFIERHLNLIGILLLTAFVGAAAGLYWDVPEKIHQAVRAKEPGGQYGCPMHPHVRRNAPGQCPDCGMRLVKSSPVPFDEPLAAQGGCCGNSAPAESAPTVRPMCPHMAALTNSSSCPAHSHP